MVSLKKKSPQDVETKSSPDINHFFNHESKTIPEFMRYRISSSIALNINTIIHKQHNKFCMTLNDSLN